MTSRFSVNRGNVRVACFCSTLPMLLPLAMHAWTIGTQASVSTLQAIGTFAAASSHLPARSQLWRTTWLWSRFPRFSIYAPRRIGQHRASFIVCIGAAGRLLNARTVTSTPTWAHTIRTVPVHRCSSGPPRSHVRAVELASLSKLAVLLCL